MISAFSLLRFSKVTTADDKDEDSESNNLGLEDRFEKDFELLEAQQNKIHFCSYFAVSRKRWSQRSRTIINNTGQSFKVGIFYV